MEYINKSIFTTSMKLKDRNRGPVGGWVYRYTITRFNGLEFPEIVYG